MGLGTYGDTRLNPLVGTTGGLLKNYKNRKWVFYDPRVTGTFDFTFPVGDAPDGSIRGRLSDEGLITAEESRVIPNGYPYPPVGNNPGDPNRRVEYDIAGQYAFVDSESLTSGPVLSSGQTPHTVFLAQRSGDCFFVISKNGAYLKTNGLVDGANPYDIGNAGDARLDGQVPIGFPADAFDNLTLEGWFMLGDSNSSRDQFTPDGNDSGLSDFGTRGMSLQVTLLPAVIPDSYVEGSFNIQFEDGYAEGWNFGANTKYEDSSQSIIASANVFNAANIEHDLYQGVQGGNVAYPLTSLFDPNEYTHVAIVRSGSEFRVYVNGSLVKTTAGPAVATNSLLDYYAVIRLYYTSQCKTIDYVQFNGKPRVKNVRFCNKALYSGSTISSEEELLTSTILERLNIK